MYRCWGHFIQKKRLDVKSWDSRWKISQASAVREQRRKRESADGSRISQMKGFGIV